jgi:Ricin-type beta-trefoil lectin domain-like
MLSLCLAAANQVKAQTASTVVAQHDFKCLDVTGASRTAGAGAVQYDCHGQSNQRWQLLPTGIGDGSYRIRVMHSLQCLDVSHGSFANRAAIVQYNCHGLPNQRWKFQ